MLQRQVEPHRGVFKEVKSRAGDASTGFEIEQIVQAAEFEVIARGKIELGDRRFAERDLGGIVFPADRHLGMREVGDRLEDFEDRCFEFVMGLLSRLFLFSQQAALGDPLLTIGVIARLADRLADLVGLAIQVLRGLQLLGALLLQFDQPIDVAIHSATAAIFFDEVWMTENELAI